MMQKFKEEIQWKIDMDREKKSQKIIMGINKGGGGE